MAALERHDIDATRGRVARLAPGRGYRGPRRLAIVALLMLVPGLSLAFAMSVTVLAQGAPSLVMDVGAPAINLGLGALGVEEISQEGDSASLVAVLAFIASVLSAAFGACLLLIATLWGIARFRPRERGRRAAALTRVAAEDVANSQAAATAGSRGRALLARARSRGTSAPPALGPAPEPVLQATVEEPGPAVSVHRTG